MTRTTKFNKGDRVWTMSLNKPVQTIITSGPIIEGTQI